MCISFHFDLKTKAQERMEKAKKEPFFNPDSQPQKHSLMEDMAMSGNQTIGLPALGVTILGLQMLGGSAQRLIQHE